MHESPENDGKFIITHYTERHCRDHVRYIKSRHNVNAESNSKQLNGTQCWEITVDNLCVREIEAQVAADGTKQYALLVDTDFEGTSLLAALGLPRLKLQKMADRWAVLVDARFTRSIFIIFAFSDVVTAQNSDFLGIPLLMDFWSRQPKPSAKGREASRKDLPIFRRWIQTIKGAFSS